MNRDLRIGLSLSLLALGVAGAFCFRADPAAVDPAVADMTADEIPATDAPNVPPTPPPAPVRLGAPPEPAVAATPAAPPPLPVPAIGPPPTIAAAAPPIPRIEGFAPAPDRFEAVAEEPESPSSSPGTYTVSPGDTLTGIAERALGSHRQYLKIYEANRDVLESPDALRVGMTLRIPGEPATL